MVALLGATAQTRALYHHLRAWSPGVHCESVTRVTLDYLKVELHIGKTTLLNSIKDLEKRKLIKTFTPSRYEGVEFQFCFDYPGSTIHIIKGQIVVISPSQDYDSKQNENHSPPRDDQSPAEVGHSPPQDQLPYIDIDIEYMDMLRNQIVDKLGIMGIFERIYKPIIADSFGVRFVADIFRRYPKATGPEIRIKITDKKNYSEYGVIDLFYQEASKLPPMTVLYDSMTGDRGVWAWHGNHGEVQIEHEDKMPEVVKINTLGQFRRWERI